jgi:hypothetical protein
MVVLNCALSVLASSDYGKWAVDGVWNIGVYI